MKRRFTVIFFFFNLAELSEDDLLSQYSFSFTKKTKKNSCEGNESTNSSEMLMPDLADGSISQKSLSTPPSKRNKFATFLQRKHEESGAVVVPGTRSRYGSIYRIFSITCSVDSILCCESKGHRYRTCCHLIIV